MVWFDPISKKYRSKVQYCNVLQKTWVVNFAEPEQIKNVATDGHALLTHSCISFIFFFFFFTNNSIFELFPLSLIYLFTYFCPRQVDGSLLAVANHDLWELKLLRL